MNPTTLLMCFGVSWQVQSLQMTNSKEKTQQVSNDWVTCSCNTNFGLKADITHCENNICRVCRQESSVHYGLCAVKKIYDGQNVREVQKGCLQPSMTKRFAPFESLTQGTLILWGLNATLEMINLCLQDNCNEQINDEAEHAMADAVGTCLPTNLAQWKMATSARVVTGLNCACNENLHRAPCTDSGCSVSRVYSQATYCMGGSAGYGCDSPFANNSPRLADYVAVLFYNGQTKQVAVACRHAHNCNKNLASPKVNLKQVLCEWFSCAGDSRKLQLTSWHAVGVAVASAMFLVLIGYVSFMILAVEIEVARRPVVT